jgi:outer membrane protein
VNYIRIVILTGACAVLSLLSQAQGAKPPYRLSLADALQKAMVLNLQVMMANARLEQAITRIAQAQSDLLPHLDGAAGGGRQTADLRSQGINFPFPGFGPQIGPFNNFDARARVTLSLFDFSAYERFQAAKKGENLSMAELEKTREDVLALVADLFIDAQRKQQTVRLLQTILQKDRMAFELSETNLGQGTGTELDSNKLKSDLDQTRYLYNQAILQAKNACLDLESALQLPLGAPLVFIDEKDFLKALEGHAINFKSADNADVALAASQLEAQKAGQKTAYADLFPKITGSADYGRSGESPAQSSNTYSVGLKATLPIWDGGSQQAGIREATAKIKEAQENLVDAGRRQEVDIAKARLAIEEADYLREAKAQERRTAQKFLLVAIHSQEIGSATVLELMQAKAQLAQAEDGYNEAQAAWIMARIDMLHAQGRLRVIAGGKLTSSP